MATASKTTKDPQITVQALDRAGARVTIIGKTPLLVNKMSAKARHTLLVGGRKKTAAERAQIKHHPFEEFRESMYLDENFSKG